MLEPYTSIVSIKDFNELGSNRLNKRQLGGEKERYLPEFLGKTSGLSCTGFTPGVRPPEGLPQLIRGGGNP